MVGDACYVKALNTFCDCSGMEMILAITISSWRVMVMVKSLS
jgi:hypothetical protein